MKKIIREVALCLVVVILGTVLSACGSPLKFVGVWEEIDYNGTPGDETLILASDGTGLLVEDSGITVSVYWNVNGDKVYFNVPLCGVTDMEEYTYHFSGNTMSLTSLDGEQSMYRKK